MNAAESALRAIKDRVAAALGELDDSASNAESKDNHRRLRVAARELHKCADEVENILMRIRPR